MEKRNLKIDRKKNKITGELQLIILFASLKLILHLLVISNFELHRDDYLYYAQSEHLAWGYFSAPPTVAIICKLATLIFGNTVFAIRFFPALIGAFCIVIIGLAIKELGGKKIAISLGSLSYLLSPSFLHTNYLLQPVCVEHFYWLLSTYLILLLIKRNNPKILIWIGIVFGFGFINKYSMVFFVVAFAISLLISQYRKLYLSKYFLFAIVAGLIIIFPNLLWQYLHNWPVLMHMSELHDTQLVNVKLSDYLFDQLLMNAHTIFLWITGLLVLLFYKKENQYRIFGLICIFIVALIALGKGKSYYTLGLYPILFIFGAYFTEKYIKKYLIYISSFLVLFMFLGLYISFSFDGIPLMTFEKALKEKAYRWEDGDYHDLPQDMSDMTGWKDIGKTVNDIFLELGTENKNNCNIFCYHYGQAGAVMFYGKKNNIPQPISFNGSFVFWSVDSLSKDYLIWVHSDLHNDFNPDSILPKRFKKVTLKATIDNRYFRENGTKIYLCEYPTPEYKIYYAKLIKQYKNKYR
ncbi:glycosyltransferase family 39 protein [Aestuariivivens sediminis]|uniref:glycosyltransferase family 39 protein n=1 Tax=Aestuariivivens sediminis TaxID=2913557 RepID=UPI001F5966A4|nr:glycosyltransferase family 39 protein [Aestuariivivens sediminis]